LILTREKDGKKITRREKQKKGLANLLHVTQSQMKDAAKRE
jgi:hypothetical protein